VRRVVHEQCRRTVGTPLECCDEAERRDGAEAELVVGPRA
jgi:hypothetical protein